MLSKSNEDSDKENGLGTSGATVDILGEEDDADVIF